MKVYALKTCDTCRKALKALRAAGHDPVVVDVRSDGLSDADITAIIAAFADRALNRSSTTWRQLSEDEKGGDAKDLLQAHPTLMKRPIIHDGDWTIGWKADAQARWL